MYGVILHTGSYLFHNGGVAFAFLGRQIETGEDTLLSGKMAAALTGAQSRGLIVTLKHFAANDQEQGRERLYTWVNEQALREIYLEPFEIGVKEGEALGIMSFFGSVK